VFRQYRKIESNEFLVVGGDTAAGGADYCTAQFLSVDKLDVPLVYHSKTLATTMTNELYPVLETLYDTTGLPPMVAYERSNGGLFEMERLAALNRLGKFDVFQMPTYGNVQTEETKRLGWDTNTATRPKMLADLKEAIDKQLITGLYDRRTIEELFAFVVVKTSSSWKAQAESGAHDDLVMALAIAWQLYQLAERPQLPASLTPPAWYKPEKSFVAGRRGA